MVSLTKSNPTSELDLGALLERHPELRIERDAYNINVTANYGSSLSPGEALDRYLQHPGAGKPMHLYFHVPLCSYLCHFCNYVKQLLPGNGRKDEVLDRWVDLLIQESSRYLERVPWLAQALVESFYVGGGTAALLGEHHLARLMEHVRASYHLTADCELTLEGNPDNFDGDLPSAALEIGFNRFSVGIQSLQDEVNRFAGRKHDSRMSIRAVKRLLATGKPFNADLMFGLPEQSNESVRNDLQTLVGMGVPTITIYRLRNADRQKMGIGNRSVWNIEKVRDRLQKEGLFPSLYETYAMRAVAVKVLLQNGYWPSPCGWWNAPGTYPDGNIPRVSRNKWQRYDTMVAFGPGAYGWLTGAGREVVQTHNETDISRYLERMTSSRTALPLAGGRLLQGEQAVASSLGFAFKANQPIHCARFRSQFGVDLRRDSPYKEVFQELCEKNLLEDGGKAAGFRPTLEGEALHEEIISVYFHQRVGLFSEQICKRTA